MITVLNTKTGEKEFVLNTNLHPHVGEILIIRDGDNKKCYRITNVVNEFFITDNDVDDLNIILYGYPSEIR